MKFSAVLCLFIILGCHHETALTKLLREQKLLKDSTYAINERIGFYLDNGYYDSARIKKSQLGPVYARLTAIQSSLDSLTNANACAAAEMK